MALRHRVALRRPRRSLVVLAVASLLMTATVLTGGTAASAAGEVSLAEGKYIGGSALGTDLDSILTVVPANAANTGSPAQVTDTRPLAVTALNAVDVDLGSGINLLGDNGILTLGAVNQFAQANSDGSSAAASGAVTDQGAIGVAGVDGVPQSDASFDLSGLIGSGLAGTLADLQLHVGALSATATQAAGVGGAQAGDYAIAGMGLDLNSPLLAGVLSDLRTTLGALQPTVDGITATLNGLGLGLVVVDGLPVLTDMVDAITSVTSSDGSITANLQTGDVHIDVADVLTTAGQDLNNLPANTDLLPYITNALSTELLPAVAGALTGLINDITSSLHNLSATVLGIQIPVGTLLSVVDPVIGTVTTPIADASAGLGTNVITPLAGALTTILSLRANAQQTTGGAFTERALQVGLLPGATPAAAQLNLASATVGPNAGPLAAPTLTSLVPDHGPEAGGTAVTVSGAGFTADATVSVDGGAAITPDSIESDGSELTFTTLAHAPAAVPVTVTTAAGTSGPLTYTFDPAQTGDLQPPVITDPEDGSTVTTNTPPISGTGTDGATVTVTEVDEICTALVQEDGTWTCTPGSPLADGEHTIVATQSDSAGNTSGPSAPVTFTVDTSGAEEVPSGSDPGDPLPGNLASTGSPILPFVLGGLALLVTGLILLAGTDRRFRFGHRHSAG